MSLPRVLIFGQPFNDKYGGGITLTNLFKGWDKDRIAVAATGHLMYGVTTDVCDNYYQLGIEEFIWIFPFSLFQRKFKSGKVSFDLNKEPENKQNKFGFRYILVNHFFYPVIEWFGLFHCIVRIRMSSRFKTWLSQFSPEILYFQVSTRDSLLFAEKLIDYLKIPSAIHVMDDWPSTISRHGLFKQYWRKRIDREFKHLLSKTDLCLSISDAMSDEYKERYNKKFIAFHNPIETKVWMQYCKQNKILDKSYIKILYSGRVGTTGVSDSLLDIASAIDSFKIKDITIKFHIQTAMQKHNILLLLQKYNCVVINPVADYKEIPKIFSEADILLLANDFNEKALSYLKLSIPTKASEYMISGTPILVYAPGETAISKFFSENDCGYCVTEPDIAKVEQAVRSLLFNREYRNRITMKAVKLAEERFDGEKVRQEFFNLLNNIAKDS